MKKTLTITLAILASSLSCASMANTDNILLVPADKSAQTQLCIQAAEKGLRNIDRKTNNAFNSRFSCNGMTLTSFAKKYGKLSAVDTDFVAKQIAKERIALVTGDNKITSRVCIDAVKNGIGTALKSHNISRHTTVICNGASLKKFVRTYKDRV
jgi:hypothetical protein